MLAPAAELEFARTDLALGRPVDAERLIAIAQEALEALKDSVPTQEAREDASRARQQAREALDMVRHTEWRFDTLARTVADAVKELRKERLPAKDRARVANILGSTLERT
jgi:hypothetical protein